MARKKEKTLKLVVTAPEGRRIPGVGSRSKGEHFELPVELAEELAAVDKGLQFEREPVKPQKVEATIEDKSSTDKEHDNAK